MKKILKKITIVILLTLIFGCDLLDNNSHTISPLDTKIDIKVYESYDSYETIAVPEIFLELTSEKIYGCKNFTFETIVKKKNQTIELEILGINKEGACMTALGPATKRIKLGKLSGIYEIKLKGNNFSNSFNAVFSDSLIYIEGEETANVKMRTGFIFKYPEKSFQYKYDREDDSLHLAIGFIDSVKSAIDLIEFSIPELCYNPYHEYFFKHRNRLSVERYFIYNSEQDYDKIEEIMRTYRANHSLEGSDAWMYTINWMNKRFNSNDL
ncbi:MAG: hypothetical protein K9G63_02860 [Melioribacteraceae bacterium]|nr:hypothetical protein [Melioribacteraceae bacterium]